MKNSRTEYDRSNAKAAAYFDQVIDSLCFNVAGIA